VQAAEGADTKLQWRDLCFSRWAHIAPRPFPTRAVSNSTLSGSLNFGRLTPMEYRFSDNAAESSTAKARRTAGKIVWDNGPEIPAKDGFHCRPKSRWVS